MLLLPWAVKALKRRRRKLNCSDGRKRLGKPGKPPAGKNFLAVGMAASGLAHPVMVNRQPPTAPNRHAATGKSIAPLAPAFHAERFTDSAKVDKWFKRNCKDVLSRECTALEKADVLAYLIGLK